MPSMHQFPEKNGQPFSPPPRTRTKSGKSSRSGNSSGKRRNRRDELLRRLNVDAEALASVPSLSPYLRLMDFSPQKIVDTLRSDEQPESVSFIRVWDGLPQASRSLIGIDGLAMASGVTPRRLWEVFNGALMVQSREMVGAMIASALPEVFKVTIRNAKKPKGHFDREHLYKVSGSLPTPKGSVTNINLGNREQALPEAGGGGELEPADDFMLKASRAMHPKALPAPVIEAVEVDEEET